MTVAGAKTSGDPATMEALSGLSERLGHVGLSLSVYDVGGEPVLSGVGDCEVCRRFCADGESCRRDRAEQVATVWAGEKPQVFASPAGCVVLGIPVKRRRRIVAVVLACYLPDELGGGEDFARLCDQQHLDRQYLAEMAARSVTHPRSEAVHWLRTVEWMIGDALANAVARTELASFSANLGNTYEELSLLYRLSGAMTVDTSPEAFFDRVCDGLLEVLGVGAAAVLLTDRLDPELPARVMRAGELALSDDRLRAMAEQIVLPVLEDKPNGAVFDDPPEGAYHGGAIANFLVAPLLSGQQSLGVLLAFNKAQGNFDNTDLKLTHSVGTQAAVFQANSRLYDEVQELLMGVLHVLTASIDAKDQYTCGHSQRVALISRKLAEMSGFGPEKVQAIYLAGLLHDIGKIGVPESVLCKPGKLSDEEFTTMKRHPVIGANILSNIRQLQSVVPGVLYHHERPDGRGYPEGLSGDNVPVQGLIVGLADCFDAMTSSRTYRRALRIEKVVAEVMRFSGTQFHPELVDHLLSLDLPTFLAELREAKPLVADISNIIRSGAA